MRFGLPLWGKRNRRCLRTLPPSLPAPLSLSAYLFRFFFVFKVGLRLGPFPATSSLIGTYSDADDYYDIVAAAAVCCCCSPHISIPHLLLFLLFVHNYYFSSSAGSGAAAAVAAAAASFRMQEFQFFVR